MRDQTRISAALRMNSHATAVRKARGFMERIWQGVHIASSENIRYVRGLNPIEAEVCGLRIWIAALVRPDASIVIEFGRVARVGYTGRRPVRDGWLALDDAEARTRHRADVGSFLIELAAEIHTTLGRSTLLGGSRATLEGSAIMENPVNP